MEPIGERLQSRREELRLTLREAETATRIRLRYLEAMEENRFDELPGEVFAKGFLRTYATYLGLDGAALVEDFKSVRPSPDPAAAAGVPTPAAARRRRRRRRAAPRGVLAAVLVLLAAAVVTLAHMARSVPPAAPAGRTTSTSGARHNPPPAAAAPRAPTPATAVKPRIVAGAPSGTLLAFTVSGAPAVAVRATFTGLCWVRVWIDGVQQTPDRTLRPGQAAAWRGLHSVRILLGNPPAAHLSVDGVSIGGIDTANPRTVLFTLGSS